MGRGMNPTSDERTRLIEDVLGSCFNGGSPYYDMYKCGYYGIDFQLCADKCRRNGIAIRRKDVDNYDNGLFKREVETSFAGQAPMSGRMAKKMTSAPVEKMRLSDMPMLPQSWKGTERRFFPCTADNRPMQRWGWSREFSPQLHLLPDARALSPVGWVGQNMLYQRFVVIDIDGRGHGEDDLSTIAFGRMFSDTTLTMEDPAKPGSFHLYFETDRLVPVRHYPWAKIDLMGNAVNAAVYLKSKKSNGLPMRQLDEKVWAALTAYQEKRKEMTYVPQP